MAIYSPFLVDRDEGRKQWVILRSGVEVPGLLFSHSEAGESEAQEIAGHLNAAWADGARETKRAILLAVGLVKEDSK